MNARVVRVGIRIGMLAIVIGFLGIFLYGQQLIRQVYEEKSINILVWPTELDAEFLVDFEKDTGIKVYVNYIEMNEELFVKLRAYRGAGYDLVMPSDYAVQSLVNEGLLAKIDKSKLQFLDTIYPALLGHYFDPHNNYTIPFFWDIYGLGINKDYFEQGMPEVSWKLIFDPAQDYLVGMPADYREMIYIACKYLYGSIDNLAQPEHIEAIKELLCKQKEWVVAYTGLRMPFLLASHSIPVASASLTEIARLSYEHPEIIYEIPKEGTFGIIDSIAISQGSQKQEYVYAFLNYLYRPDVITKYVKKYGIFSPIKGVVIDDVPAKYTIPTQALFNRVDFFRNVIDQYTLSRIWVSIVA